jgi:predicted nucleic acid-binding protein
MPPSRNHVVDSSAWLEYFADGPNAPRFAPAIEATSRLIVPSIVILEVYKRMHHLRGERAAQRAAAQLMQGVVIDLDSHVALTAAQLGLSLKLPLADSIILATARIHDALVWTQDDDFKDLDDVKYYPRQ